MSAHLAFIQLFNHFFVRVLSNQTQGNQNNRAKALQKQPATHLTITLAGLSTRFACLLLALDD